MLSGGCFVKVEVRKNDVGQAMRVLKKKLQRDGMFKEMRKRVAFEKPSETKRRKKAEAISRHKKEIKKRLMED